ncbi:EKC KEOPS complex subunit bud32-like isoform X1 [Chlorella sorokiniana]|uniref:non-specific serine/threonine protein kinase n=1 Tax=Chlorella sorokiniana TaxID=3076 RepID=A0A2P6TXU3_CHLSO|nr:EKC KEOPS complex subunit bud32-like isoform X1 [Chlorella sorokiniana]|eukprot:PRW58873.1 EKC KEOPS complex subunit bud32-like isoform X1 [Chlorella sorokiniana]
MAATATVAATAVAAAVGAAAVAAPPQATAAAPAEQQQQRQQQQQPVEFDSSRYTLHSQGAEARVWEGTFLSRPAIIKQRFSKKYRHPQLDGKLTASRLKSEVRSMLKARKLGVHTPVVYHVDHATSSIYMERVQGHSLKTLLHGGQLGGTGLEELLVSVGRTIAKLHDGGLVHGDLTTSNMMMRTEDRQLVLIDFGLAYNSTIPEDKGVDLYVLERAFASAHAEEGAAMFEKVLEAYRRASRQWSATLNRFAEVRMRGRKRAMVG